MPLEERTGTKQTTNGKRVDRERVPDGFVHRHNDATAEQLFSREEHGELSIDIHTFIHLKEQLQTHPQMTNAWIVKRFPGYKSGNEMLERKFMTFCSIPTREHRLAKFHLSPVVGPICLVHRAD